MRVSSFLIDAGPLAALLNRRDAHHGWAQTVFDALDAPLMTSEAVLSEAWFLLRRGGADPAVLLDLLALLHVEVVPTWYLDVTRVLRRYADRTSVADASLLALAEAEAGRIVVTTDRTDFTVYRIHGRSAVPALMPPE